MKKTGILFLCAALTACTVGVRAGSDGGVGGGDGATGADGAIGPRIDYATVTGTVWAPGNAPGMVPAGQEIPIFDALITITPTRRPAIPAGVYCEQCVSVSGPHGRSSHDGTFSVGSIVPGDYWLTVEKGQFRLEREISLGEGETLALSASYTTLPSTHDPARGQTVPSIAVAAGSYDSLEDVLGKMAIGGVDSGGEWQTGPGADRIHFYSNGTYRDFPTVTGSFGDLVRDLPAMMRYHIIFVPCSNDENTSELYDPAVLRNLREYVAAGGKLYVTDWSGEWMDNVFPAFLDLEPDVDTPASAYDAASNTWSTSQFGDADGSSYDSNNAEAADEDLRTWLQGQRGPTAFGGEETYDAGNFDVEGNWNTIFNMNRIQVGLDEEGLPVTDMPVAFVIGGEGTSTPKRPLTVTFEPAGCGRVLYSTYHTTDDSHVGLVPQERILLYLIMQIGVCQERPILI